MREYSRQFARAIIAATALLLCTPNGYSVLARSVPNVRPSRQGQVQQDQKAAAKLAAIIVTGSARFSSDQIAPLTGMTVGQNVGRETFQQAADRLAALGCFSSVRYTFSSQADAVRVEFQVTDGPAVPVSFDNFPWLDDNNIISTLKARVGLFDGSAPQQGTLLGMIGDALAKLLAEKGVKGTIQSRLLATPGGDHQVMQFRVDGPILTVAGVQFSDALAQHDPRLQDRLSDIVGKPYSRYTLEVFNLEQVRPVYFQHGFLHVHFGPVQPRLAGDPNKPIAQPVLVTAPIDPGPAYTWGGVKWSGNSAISGPELDIVLPLHIGAPADGLEIIAGWDSVRAEYGARGYLDALVEPVEAFDDPHNRAVYFVKITEGPQYRMGELVLTGLSLAAERRIRAAWNIAPGAAFNLGYFDTFVATGARQALATLPVHIDNIGHFLRTNPQQATVDVLLDFQ